MSFEKLDGLCRSLEALEHAQAILGADEATHMATGGGEKRAEALAALAGMVHRQMTAPQVAEWIEAARGQALSPEQGIALAEFERRHRDMTCLPADFVERQTNARIRSEQMWRVMRARGDWEGFLPALESVVAMAREEAGMRAAASGLAPYDAMIDQYDPGLRQSAIEPVFDRLKQFLPGFLEIALEAQAVRHAIRPVRPLSGVYPIDRQRELGMAMMAAVGFDFSRGSLSISHHPFCGGVPTDVRLTTRYRSDEFLSSLMGILHETGHGLYEQNLPAEWSHWPSGKARGMAMHESQSLFIEKQIGRNPAFWRFALPHVEEHLGESWTLEEILPHVHRVGRGLIRVDADEVSYPLHIILRFEIEKDLIAGGLAVRDLPQAWDEKMRAYLGISTIGNPADGPMQDVHWPSGAFGYFPSYTLGALMAAQQWSAILREHADAEAQIEAGRFEAINDWRRRHVWERASFGSTMEILAHATGEALNPDHFIAHLERRYGPDAVH